MESGVSRWRRWALLGVEPPARGAGRVATLRFLRDFQVRTILLMAPFELILILLGLPTGLLALALAGFALMIVHALYLTAKLRRAARGYPDQSSS